MINNNTFFKKVKKIYRSAISLFVIIVLLSLGLMVKVYWPSFFVFDNKTSTETYVNSNDFGSIENGIHVATGLKDDDYLPLVITHCTPCHSAKLVTQNRATKEGWSGIIKWMQETQNLWDLGNNEDLITTYLAKNYGPKKKGRRSILTHIDWYDLED